LLQTTLCWQAEFSGTEGVQKMNRFFLDDFLDFFSKVDKITSNPNEEQNHKAIELDL
jgi:hypothetical protein